MKPAPLSLLPEALLPWYEENKRDLPWRNSKEPYQIWLSEIMLQQTRVEAVKSYYARFLQALPTIEDLANCDDEKLHKLWEGLGYYNRVRNMKKCAQTILRTYGGVFPSRYEDVLALPGIGPYTAGAICSICFGLPTPAVDGNVLRVITRITADGTPIDSPAFQKQVRGDLAEIYPQNAGDFTQALMELGATLCGPNRKPDCNNCPCRAFCQSVKTGNWDAYPVRSPKKSRRLEEMTVFLLSCQGYYALQKRPDHGILAGLWEFPHTPGILSVPDALTYLEGLGISVREVKRQRKCTHIFTHVQWEMNGIYLEVSQKHPSFVWLCAEEIEKETALPTAFRQFWEGQHHV